MSVWTRSDIIQWIGDAANATSYQKDAPEVIEWINEMADKLKARVGMTVTHTHHYALMKARSATGSRYLYRVCETCGDTARLEVTLSVLERWRPVQSQPEEVE